LRAAVGTGVPGGSLGVTVHTPPPWPKDANSLTFTVYWEPLSSFAAGLVSRRCKSDEASFGVQVREEPISVAGTTAIACRGVGRTFYHGVDPVSVEVPDSLDGGWVRVFAFHDGPDLALSKELIRQILNSLQIHD